METQSEYDKAVEVVREKPLNQTQLKNLRELVAGDFDELRSQVMDEIERRLRRRLEAIEEEYSKNGDLDKIRKQLDDDVRRTYDRLVAKVKKLVEKEGIGIYYASKDIEQSASAIVAVNVSTNCIKQKGKDQAIVKARKQASALEQTAFAVIQREQRKIDRQCLLQGISGHAAMDLINDLPEPADILPLVAAEMQLKESKAMDELMGDVPALEGADE